jgi:hypothetical protein
VHRCPSRLPEISNLSIDPLLLSYKPVDYGGNSSGGQSFRLPAWQPRTEWLNGLTSGGTAELRTRSQKTTGVERSKVGG